MKAAQTALGACAFLSIVACGAGAPPPAQTGPSTPEARTAEPSAPEPTASAELLAGIKAFDAGNYADARSSFQAAVKKNSNDYEALYNLGMTCEKLQDKQGAEQAYKSALAVKPDSRMPKLPLSDADISELAAFLSQQRAGGAK